MTAPKGWVFSGSVCTMNAFDMGASSKGRSLKQLII